jgi:hypothetical protein
MSVSLEEITGRIVKRVITRAKKDITVNMLVANDGREIIVRSSEALPIDKPIRTIGVIDGAIFLVHEIQVLE